MRPSSHALPANSILGLLRRVNLMAECSPYRLQRQESYLQRGSRNLGSESHFIPFKLRQLKLREAYALLVSVSLFCYLLNRGKFLARRKISRKQCDGCLRRERKIVKRLGERSRIDFDIRNYVANLTNLGFIFEVYSTSLATRFLNRAS